MSTTVVETNTELRTASRRKASLPAWTREPLLHFIALGGLLFGADHAISSRTSDLNTLVVDAEVDAHAISVFKNARGREPNNEELYALRKVWLDNEVLYREGLALGLEKGDKAIRERVIFKALSVVDASVKLPAFDEAVLRAWFEKYRDKYDAPARYDFEEAVMAGERSDSATRAFAAALNSGDPGNVEAGLRVFTARPHDNIVQSYGAEFAAALETAPAGEWQALPSREGLRVMRLKSLTSATPAKFENLRAVVLQDWTDAVMAEQRSAAVRELARKYTIKVKGEKP
jgi:hypothetical protein